MGCCSSKNNFNFDPDMPGLSDEYQMYPLLKREQQTHDTFVFTFGLQTNDTKIGLNVGQHLMIKFKDKSSGDDVLRPYTPISDVDMLGKFELLVKIYEHGKMTQYLNALKIGDKILCKGPLGHINYIRPNVFKIKKGNEYNEMKVSNVGMIGGGTGITPLYQIMMSIVKNGNENDIKVEMMYSNKTIDDILLKDELDSIDNNNDNINIHYTLRDSVCLYIIYSQIYVSVFVSYMFRIMIMIGMVI